MDFRVNVCTGADPYTQAYRGRYETREGGVLLVIDDESRTKTTYGPTGWLWVEEDPEDDES